MSHARPHPGPLPREGDYPDFRTVGRISDFFGHKSLSDSGGIVENACGPTYPLVLPPPSRGKFPALCFSNAAPSLTPWQILDQLGRIALVEVWFELRDGRRMCLPRITQPETAQAVLLAQLQWTLPQQPPPRVHACQAPAIETPPSGIAPDL